MGSEETGSRHRKYQHILLSIFYLPCGNTLGPHQYCRRNRNLPSLPNPYNYLRIRKLRLRHWLDTRPCRYRQGNTSHAVRTIPERRHLRRSLFCTSVLTLRKLCSSCRLKTWLTSISEIMSVACFVFGLCIYLVDWFFGSSVRNSFVFLYCFVCIK